MSSETASEETTGKRLDTIAYLKPMMDVSLAMIIGFAIGAILLALWGYDPLKAYTALFKGSLGNMRVFGNTLAGATPLILTGLTFAIGVRAGLFNIGAQGQMYFGAIAALTVSLIALPPILHVPLAVLAAMLAGMVWSIGPAILKITRGVHEVISTIMFNWIGRWLAPFLMTVYLLHATESYKTFSVVESSRFALMISRSDLTTGLFVSIIVAFLVYWFFWHMPQGFELRMAGLNPDATCYSGASPHRSMLWAFALGGMTAGLGGAMQVLAKPTSFSMDIGLTGFGNLGFDGIAVALIGRNHPLGVIFGGIFFGALASGARMMQISADVPLDMIRIVQGTIIIAVAVPELHKLITGWRKQS